jgi:serine/threonine protein kinase
LNEIRAIDKLYRDGPNDNLVEISHHGWLPSLSYYYIDMEFCELNLDEYIEGKTPSGFLLENPRVLGAPFLERGTWCIWDIMQQISCGVQFIHSCQEVHRDLKPRNGTREPNQAVLTQSAVFCEGQGMEIG